MVVVRLKRMGNRNRAFYRVVVTDSRNGKAGKCLNIVGTYNPLNDPPDIELDMEKIREWQTKGAKVSDTVKSLIRRCEHETADRTDSQTAG